MPRLSDLPNSNFTGNSSAINVPKAGIRVTTPMTLPDDIFKSKAMPTAWDKSLSALGTGFNTIMSPFNAGFDIISRQTDPNKLLDPNKSFLEKLPSTSDLSYVGDILSRGWQEGGLFGAVNKLAEEGKDPSDIVANTSSLLNYGLSSALGSDTAREDALKFNKDFEKNYPVAYHAGGLGLSLLAPDPLSVIRLGSTALKTAERAGLLAARAEEKAAGVAGKSKTIDEALTKIQEKAGPEVAKKAQASIASKVKEARRVADNAMISLALPYTDRTKTIVNKPKFLRRTADTLGEQGAVAVGKLLPQVEQGKIQDLLQTRYGVNSAEDMTIDMLRDLQKAVDELPAPKMIKEVETGTNKVPVTKDIPFSLANILKPYSQEVKDLAKGLVQKGATPEQIIAELPNLLRGKVGQTAPTDLGKVLPTFEIGQTKLFKGQPVQIIEADPKFPRTVKVQFADGSTSIAKKADVSDIAQTMQKTVPTVSNVSAAFVIPKELAGSKPRYGYKDKQFSLKFDSDLDKALYVIAGTGKSKAHDKFLNLLMDHTGLSEAGLIAEGQKVRNAIKELAKSSDEGQLSINSISSLGRNKVQQAVEDIKELPKTLAKSSDIPFVNGSTFHAGTNVPKEVAQITEQWKNMLGISERMVLVNVDDAVIGSKQLTKAKRDGIDNIIDGIKKGLEEGKISDTTYYTQLNNLLNSAKNGFRKQNLGLMGRTPSGDFVVLYRGGRTVPQMLTTISHEMGHALMYSRYEKASPAIKKAIDADYEKWLRSTKGASSEDIIKSVAPYAKFEKYYSDGVGQLSKKYLDYITSKDEWFAEQVARWATTSEKPLSVVEKFFYDIAQKLKQFFQKNKQWMASKSMQTWLDDLAKSYKTSAPTVEKQVVAQQVEEATKALPTTQQLQQIKKFDQKTITEINDLAKQIEQSLPIKQITKMVDEPYERVVEVKEKGYDPIALLKQGDKFVQDAGGRSKLARSISSWWNARKDNAVGHAFIDEYTKLIRDTNIRSIGELKYIQRDLAQMQDIAKNMTPLELKAVQYVVEKAFPTTMSEQSIRALMNNANVKQLADKTTEILKALGKEEEAKGLLNKLREDYFPHMMKFDEKAWEKFKMKYADDPQVAAFIGKGTVAGFMKERKGFDTLAELDDLIVRNRELASKGDMMAAEKADDLEKIFNRNTLDALNERVKISTRTKAYKDLYNQMKADGLLVEKGQGVPSYMLGDYVALDAKTALKVGAEPGAMIHKDILEAMNKVENKFTRKEMNKFFQLLNDSHRLWSLMTYKLLPKHHVNNLTGNLFNASLAGMRREDLQEASRLLMSAKNKTASMKEMELIKQAYLDGVLGQGFRAEFDSLKLGNDSLISKVADKIENLWYSKNIMRVGEMVDDWTRLALYLRGLKQAGGTQKSASDLVRKYLFNYNEATDMDRKLRMVFPFWLWMKNNIPLQLQALYKNPAFLTTAERIRRSTFGEDDPLENQKEYIRDGYINIGGTKFKFNLPMYDLNMLSGSPKEMLKNVALATSPFIQSGIELAQNKQLLTGAPIQKEMNRRYNPQEDYDLPTLAGYLGKKFGGYPGWVASDIQKNLGEKGTLTPLDELGRILLSAGIATPSLEK